MKSRAIRKAFKQLIFYNTQNNSKCTFQNSPDLNLMLLFVTAMRSFLLIQIVFMSNIFCNRYLWNVPCVSSNTFAQLQSVIFRIRVPRPMSAYNTTSRTNKNRVLVTKNTHVSNVCEFYFEICSTPDSQHRSSVRWSSIKIFCNQSCVEALFSCNDL